MTHIAIVHPTHLVATELRETLDRRRELWQKLDLLSTLEQEIGTLTEVRGEAAVVTAVDGGSFDGVDVAFFFGPASSYRSLLTKLPATTTAVVMSESTDEADGLPIVAGLNLEQVGESSTLSSPHPAVIALAYLLSPLAPFNPRRLNVTVHQPASLFGNEGLDELLEQTRRILSFQSSEEEGALPQGLAFNLFEAPGGNAGIVGPLKSTLAASSFDQQASGSAKELDITCQVLQTGVFHGFGLSLHLELETDPGFDPLCAALDASPHLDLDTHPHRLGPKESVAKEVILVGSPKPAGDGRYTLWAAFDNLTVGGAMNAVSLLEALAPSLEGH